MRTSPCDDLIGELRRFLAPAAALAVAAGGMATLGWPGSDPIATSPPPPVTTGVAAPASDGSVAEDLASVGASIGEGVR